MPVKQLECDYLIVGTGAMGLAFADEIITHKPGATIIFLDRRAKPGGHWNDAYPFVSLHQPAAFYGVNSRTLGTGGAALASGKEVLAYFERVLTDMLATGRVQHFPMCTYEGNGRFTSIIAPEKSYEVTVREKTVDSTYMNVQVPSTTPPKYEVSPDVDLIPLNDLTKVREPVSEFVIIGAGKTGIDAILFLLAQGVDPDSITWIMPNDSWLMEREFIQPKQVLQWFEAQFSVLQHAKSVDEVYAELEKRKVFFRIDESVEPVKFRCATVNSEELRLLCSIKNVVRMGRIKSVQPGELVLEQGTRSTDANALHVDCTADPLAKRPVCPVFDGNQITLQSVSMCQQVFSAAVIGNLECQSISEEEKNHRSQPVPHPEYKEDFIASMSVTLNNAVILGKTMGRWMLRSRLSPSHHDSFFKQMMVGYRINKNAPATLENLRVLYEQAFPDSEFPVSSVPKAS